MRPALQRALPCVFALVVFLAGLPQARAFTLFLASGGATTGDQAKAAAELVGAFKLDYPGASIEMDVSTSYIKGITETLMQNFGNETPDVAIVGLVEWPILHRKKMLRRLDSVVPPQKLAQIWKSLLPEATAQRYGANLPARDFALPFNRGTPVLYVNLALLPELAARSAITWTELASVLRSAAEKATTGKGVLRLAAPADDWVSEAIFLGARGAPTLAGKAAHFDDSASQLVIGELRRLYEHERLYVPANQRVAYDDFLAGHAALALFSTSAYNSVAARAQFPFKALFPPYLKYKHVDGGGGDLVFPDNPNKPLDEKKKKDMRSFVEWFYGGKGDLLWAKSASMFALTRAAADNHLYKDALAARPDQLRIFRNTDRWSVRSFYELDELCNAIRLRQLASKAFQDAVTGHATTPVLAQASAFLTKFLVEQPCP